MVPQAVANERRREEIVIQRISELPLRVSIILIIALICQSCFFRATTFSYEEDSYSRHLRDAEEARRKKDYDKAIEAYLAHVVSRLESEDKPEWENPYFYYLLVGDLYLQQGKIEDALSSYEFAEAKSVDVGLVSDRYRSVANWLAKQDRYEEAVNLLNRYRERDELLFDMMRDRIAREKVLKEEKTLTTHSDPQNPQPAESP